MFDHVYADELNILFCNVDSFCDGNSGSAFYCHCSILFLTSGGKQKINKQNLKKK